MRLRGFTDRELIEGGEPARLEAAKMLRRDQRLKIARDSGALELEYEDLRRHFAGYEHVPTGAFFSLNRGEVFGGQFDNIAAYVVLQDDVMLLETPAGGPKSRQELAEDRERRKAERGAAPRRFGGN